MNRDMCAYFDFNTSTCNSRKTSCISYVSIQTHELRSYICSLDGNRVI